VHKRHTPFASSLPSSALWAGLTSCDSPRGLRHLPLRLSTHAGAGGNMHGIVATCNTNARVGAHEPVGHFEHSEENHGLLDFNDHVYLRRTWTPPPPSLRSGPDWEQDLASVD
jgi:hypothetical protein